MEISIEVNQEFSQYLQFMTSMMMSLNHIKRHHKTFRDPLSISMRIAVNQLQQKKGPFSFFPFCNQYVCHTRKWSMQTSGKV